MTPKYPLSPHATPEDRAEFERRVQAGRAWARSEPRYGEAFIWRQRFAEDRGFPDFAAVMEYGIVRANNLPTLPGSTT